MSEQNQPEQHDAVLGGNSPLAQPRSSDLVLGYLGRRTANLQNLLRRKEWQAADLETHEIVLELCRRRAHRFLRMNDLSKIQCHHWRAIDNLWTTYSQNRFGLSVQAKIWRSIEGTPNPDWNMWCRFGEITGWCSEDYYWLHWNDVRFDLDAPSGHLPRSGAWLGWGLGDYWVGCEMFSKIAQQLENCQII